MSAPDHNLIGLTLQELSDFAVGIGEPRYRGKQLFEWLYSKRARSFGEMTNLGKVFRQHLERSAEIQSITLLTQQVSRIDGTTKFLFGLHDGLKIESVLIPPASSFRGKEAAREDEQKRHTLCISSQSGCPLDCKFCATGTMGFQRNLTVGEIVDQVLQVGHATGKRITNIVFMGMGEPMMNYAAVMKAVEILVCGMAIAARRITISTAGWADKIRQLGDENRRTKLAVSLHSAVDETRTQLMPINKKFSLDVLIDAIGYYYAMTKQRVTYEYIFFDGINDSEREVKELIRLARRVPSKINVIPFHSIAFAHPTGFASELRASPRMDNIVEELRRNHLAVMVRSNAGEDIDAACGQLAVKVERQKARQRRSNTPQPIPGIEFSSNL